MPGAESLKRNNLDKSSSPYLLQHADNPIWWQEWSREVLEQAARNNMPVFVSVGYATCHWCHVMAAEAFSDTATASYLNDNYVCIKVDREQRPDIDQFMMHFIQAQSGSGGWPLNVFLTPDLRPIAALTYAPAISGGNRMSFLDVAKSVHQYFETNGNEIAPFNDSEDEPSVAGEDTLVEELTSYFDHDNGGFGTGQKFPPHSTLLFLLYLLLVRDDGEINTLCTSTLDAMMLRGLNDHLQGGIFRYCVDREWTIPHFEKMLYDQAMALWCYSLGYKVTGKEDYKIMAEKIVRCLDECFEDDRLYISAFNADTDHEEGATYLWSFREIEGALDPEDFRRFCEAYIISEEGNFEGLNHLIRKNNTPLKDIEDKLLTIRKSRKQPSRDDKIVCGINALVAASIIQAGRLLDKPELEEKAATVVEELLNRFWDGTTLGHSYYNGMLQKQSFLSDAGAMLTVITMLFENDETWGGMMTSMALYAESFKDDGKWIESRAEDFQTVYASWFDHPVPSGVSLAVTGLTRAALLSEKEIGSADYRRPFQSDFYNINVLISNGLFHVYTSNTLIPWKLLPANCLQKKGEPATDCFNKFCKVLDLKDIAQG
jgi:uncharacterized protein YyaL (SSP411 family)